MPPTQEETVASLPKQDKSNEKSSMKEVEYSGESFAGATVSSLLTTSTKYSRTLFALCAAVVLATAATHGNMNVNDINLKPATRALSDVHEPLFKGKGSKRVLTGGKSKGKGGNSAANRKRSRVTLSPSTTPSTTPTAVPTAVPTEGKGKGGKRDKEDKKDRKRLIVTDPPTAAPTAGKGKGSKRALTGGKSKGGGKRSANKKDLSTAPPSNIPSTTPTAAPTEGKGKGDKEDKKDRKRLIVTDPPTAAPTAGKGKGSKRAN